MGKDSGVEWCDHTFNPIWGCVKCDPGCEQCYADSLASRFGYDVWGNRPRRLFGEKHWNQPRHWNTAARKAGKKALVFCGSMCDVFEKHPDPEYNELVLDAERDKLWNLIEETPWLIWLLLTKRPENMVEMVPWDEWPENAWAGASVCEFNGMWRIAELLKVPATKHFLSCEPLLEAIDLTRVQVLPNKAVDSLTGAAHFQSSPILGYMPCDSQALAWVIYGGESEQRGRARTFPVDGTTSMIDQCDLAGVPVFVKQMGTVWARENGVYQLGDRKGTNIEYWPEALRRQEFPDYE